jgi:thiol peroxidase
MNRNRKQVARLWISRSLPCAVAVAALIGAGAAQGPARGAPAAETSPETSWDARELPEHEGIVAMRGTPVTLLGAQVRAGDEAPDFRVVDLAFQPVRFADFAGRVRLISVVPSLDTQLCATQTKRFNEEIAALPSELVALTISMDLPFAQKRFCEAESVDHVRTLSDHVWREFGERYGVLIKDRGQLARAVFVVGRDGRITYMEIVPDTTQHPDYDAALEAVRSALS